MDLSRRKSEEMTFEELRSALKKEGVPPGNRVYNERPLLISSSSEVFEPYPVPEGDGKVSLPESLSSSVSSSEGRSEMATKLKDKVMIKDRRAIWKIKKKLGDDWDEKEFPQQAVEIYIDAHKALENRDSDKLHDLVTEKAYPEMWKEVHLRSFKWNFIENLEPPTIVRVRTQAQVSSSNYYAQVTVRIHSKQTLAIYDQFGRLMIGSESIEIPVVEHVVFENHIVNRYGTWRLHAKLLPAKSTKKKSLLRNLSKINTFVLKELSKKYEEVPDHVDKWIDAPEEDEEEEKSKKPVVA